MTRLLSTMTGLVLLFFGAMAALVLRAVPPPTVVAWLGPILVGGGGLWMVRRSLRWPATLAGTLAALGGAWLAVGGVWPDRLKPPSEPPAQQQAKVAESEAMVSVALEVPDTFRFVPFARPRTLSVPEGFAISVFAAGLDAPRFMAVDGAGTLFVSTPRSGKVLALPDADDNGVADRVVTYAEGLSRPHGLAFHKGALYIAGTGELLRARDDDGDLQADAVEVLSRDIPGGGGHWTRSLAVGPDGRLFVSTGSSCNVCIEEDWRRAAILVFPPQGGDARLYASGLRNSVGLTFHPQTGELWASNNGRDMLGDDLPPEEINRIVEGADYGWPFCYGNRIPDPEFGSEERCAGTVTPEVEMKAHSAPLGIAFGEGLAFPEPYRNMLYVAFHGSWNRSVPTGYKLVGIPFVGGRPAGAPIDIAEGWLLGASAWGRPVAPVVGADGALYLSDDRAGAIYRITVRQGRGAI